MSPSTEPEDAGRLGPEIRDLLGDYRPPVDPYRLVAARIAARRARRRAYAAVATAVAAVTVVALAATGIVGAPGRPTTQLADPAAPIGPQAASGAQFAQFGDRSPLGPAYVVASGTAAGRSYRIASVNFGTPGRTCMYADDEVFAQLSHCFAAPAGHRGTWAPLARLRTGTAVAAVGGVADTHLRQLVVHTADGRRLPLTAVRTPTSADRAFFALVLPGGARIAAVTAVDETGSTVTLPQDGTGPCQPGQLAAADCATRPSTPS